MTAPAGDAARPDAAGGGAPSAGDGARPDATDGGTPSTRDGARPDATDGGTPSAGDGARGDGLATGFASADESPGLLLWQVTNRWQAAQRAALKPYGLTHVQFVLLASLTYLQAEGTPVTQRRLADHAVTDPMMTSQVLRALEGRGLVTRGPHPHDARARTLAVTPEGREVANRAVAAAEACDAAFFAPLAGATPAFTSALHTLRP
ncbi:MAG: winged helix-turn-helix transcriptional regulator [Streptomyces sp.]|nr:winged helix-turn-helix transcriptional regulator [Streptomyces sp.]